MNATQPYLRPGWLLNRVVNPLVARLGAAPVLAVPGRKSGRVRAVPVNVLEVESKRYLVSPRGETEWVRNLRTAGRGEIRRRTRVEPFRAVEVDPAEKPRLIEAYVARWGGQVRQWFRKLPDPADHPVFRLEPD